MNARYSSLGAVAALLAPTLAAATFAVTTTADSFLSPQPGMLRWAIQQANSTPGPDTIVFNIPGAGVHTIVLQAPLPALNDISGGTLIDGLSQPGAGAGGNPPSTATLLIELQGHQAGPATGIRIWSDDNTVRGLVINQFAIDGIHIEGQFARTADDNVLFCNFVGTDPSGTVDLGNGTVFGPLRAGVHVANLVGGTAQRSIIDRNLVSANWSDGVWIEGPRFPGEVGFHDVTDNYIGTDVTGKFDLGNDHEGVTLTEGAHDNDVLRNLISGNDTDGVGLQGFDNFGMGAPLYTRNNLIADNLIGVDIDILPLPNSLHGVAIGSYGPTSWGFAIDNTIRNNVIANNGGAGVSVVEVAFNTINADRNRISQNAIWSNVGRGIDLGLDGVTPNDVGDLDMGANRELNTPANIAVAYNTPATVISGTLGIDSLPHFATIELFKALPDGSGHGQGQWYLGSTTPSSTGTWSFSTSRLAPGDVVTATATDGSNNTSEFALDTSVPAAPTLTIDSNFFPARLGGIVNFSLDAGAGNANRIYLIAGTLSGTSPGVPLGTVTVPLNPDAFTSLGLGLANSSALAGFLGVTDGTGRASAQLNFLGLLNPAWAGALMHFAGVLIPFDFASNPVAVEIMPW